MQSAEEEKYVFYRFASGDMLQALSHLKQLSRYRKNSPRHAFLLQAVLSYCRPFKRCYGKHDNYKLPESFVPEKQIPLHKEISKWRDQVFAHTDLNIRRPRLKRWRTPTGNILPIQFKGFSPSILEKNIPQFRELIDTVRTKVDQHIYILESKLPQSYTE
jgi:hypothetical protein